MWSIIKVCAIIVAGGAAVYFILDQPEEKQWQSFTILYAWLLYWKLQDIERTLRDTGSNIKCVEENTNQTNVILNELKEGK